MDDGGANGTDVRVFLAGGLRLEVGDRTADERHLGGRQSRLAAAFVLTERHRPVPRAELAEALWPGELPRSWEASLRNALARVRAFLGAAGLPAGALRTVHGALRLDLPPGAVVDVEEAGAALDAAAPAAPDGADGWYVSAPTVSWACADATSGVVACSADATAPEGVTTAFSGTARDHAGNAATATVGPAKVDLTDPAVACGTRPAFALGQAGAVVSATVTDAGSGPAQVTVTAPAATGTVGVHTAAVTGTDRAGRTTTVLCSYAVGFGFSGFFAPVENDAVNLARADQVIPLKWRVVDGAGAGVTTLTRVSVTVTDRACAAGATADAVEEYATGSSGLQNKGDGHYQLNWATPKSYAGSCKTLRLDLGDGVARTADFSFTR